jgi:hypothetical protein
MAMGFGPATLKNKRVAGKKDFADRVVRDKRYKLWVVDGKPAKLFDLKTDPAESTNLIDSENPDIAAARQKLKAVVEACPRKDSAPQYDPTPAQPWDGGPLSRSSKRKKQ